jgi:WD40 repeat protein
MVVSVAFSPDGKTLASGSADSTVILWDVESRQPVGQPLRGHTSTVTSVTFSHDGKTLASSSTDKTVILWDVESRQSIGEPQRGHTEAVFSLAFSPDDTKLASGSLDQTIMLWDVTPDSWTTTACNLVRRNFTQTEWQQYFANEPYRKICPKWPAGE